MLILEAVPSPSMKRTVCGQVLASATNKQRAVPWTGRSTPRGRNWLGPSPILSAGFAVSGNTAVGRLSAIKSPAADGRLADSLRLNLETKIRQEVKNTEGINERT